MPKNLAAVELGRLGWSKGGNARAAALSSEERRSIAQRGGLARWGHVVTVLPPDVLHTANDRNLGGYRDLIEGLFIELPSQGSEWSIEDRVKWLRLATAIFDLVYSRTDDRQLEISVSPASP